MNIKKVLSFSFWKFDRKKFNEIYGYDLKFNASFRGTNERSKYLQNLQEVRYVKLYRQAQVSRGTIWGKLYFYPKLVRYSIKTGMGLYENLNIPRGLIIGHAGTIVISPNAVIGENFMVTHGVTIGRENRGKRKGSPKIGKNVCIKCNSTIIGNITIGDDVLVASNSFVNFDIPSHSVVVGNLGTIHPRENATEGYLGKVDE